MATVTSATGVFSDEVLAGISARGWAIKLIEGTAKIDRLARVIKRIGPLMQELCLKSELTDLDMVPMVFSFGPNMRKLELVLPHKIHDTQSDIGEFCPDPPSRIALLICVLRKCQHCEGVILRNLGKRVDDVEDILRECPHVKRISFPEWEDYPTDVLEAMQLILVDNLDLDFVQLDNCSYDRKVGSLCLSMNRHGELIKLERLSVLLDQCPELLRLSVGHADLWPWHISGIAPNLVALSLKSIRGEDGDRCNFTNLIKNCNNLQELRLDWPALFDDDLIAISTCCTQLRLLHLVDTSFCIEFTEEGLITLLSLPSLKEVEIICTPSVLSDLFQAMLSRIVRLDKLVLRTIFFATCENDVNHFFRIAARKVGLLPVPTVDIVEHQRWC